MYIPHAEYRNSTGAVQGQYLVTGGREVETVLTVHPDQRWELADGAKLYDVTHLPCRAARYKPANGGSGAGSGAGTPAKRTCVRLPRDPRRSDAAGHGVREAGLRRRVRHGCGPVSDSAVIARAVSTQSCDLTQTACFCSFRAYVIIIVFTVPMPARDRCVTREACACVCPCVRAFPV